MKATNHYEIQGACDGLNEQARALFWEVFEDAARDVPKDAPKTEMKRPELFLDGLRRYLRDEVSLGDPSVEDAVAYFCAAARAEGLGSEAYVVMIYAKAYFRKVSGGSGGSGQPGGRVRKSGAVRSSRRMGVER